MSNVTILLIDDVHLEHRTDEIKQDFANTLSSKISSVKNNNHTPILLCAGDINERTQGIEWLKQFDCDIVYICGNHEFWGGDYYEVIRDIKAKNKEAGYEHIHFLHNETVILHNFRFIGGPLWTNFLADLPWIGKNKILENYFSMADFKKITAKEFYDNPNNVQALQKVLELNDAPESRIKDTIEGKMFNPLVQLSEYQATESFIEKELNIPFSGQTVVLTHHLPIIDIWGENLKFNKDTLSAKFINNPDAFKNKDEIENKESSSRKVLMTGFYVNDLKAKFFYKNNSPELWVHGHYHQEVQGYIGKTQIASCPIGHFKPGLSQTLNIKEIPMTAEGSKKLVSKYLALQIKKVNFEGTTIALINNLQNIIKSSYVMYNAGLASTIDLEPLISGLHNQIKLSLDEHSKKIARELSLYIEHSGKVTKPNYLEEYYLAEKVSGLNKWILKNEQQTYPVLKDFIFNANSFSDGKKEDNHYTDWLASLFKLEEDIKKYKETLLLFTESLIDEN